MAGQSESGVELSIVVPVYNEAPNIDPFLKRTEPVLEKITPNYEIIFCLDPCRDGTEESVRKNIERNPRVRLLIMSRRWGQDACMTAGFEECRGEACVIIDVDMQDPPELIVEMHRKWKHEGFDVVYAERRRREGDPLPRRIAAFCGYWVINRISDVGIPRNVGDFRLIDRRVIEGLRQLRETHGFLRGLVPYVGYKQTSVLYDREERKSGESKYSAAYGSIKHGLNGIVAFSIVPLQLSAMLGFAAASLSLLLTLFYVAEKIVIHQKLNTGIAPVMLLVTFLGGVQLLCVGVLGEYIGRIYDEVRQRPKYLIAEKVNFPKEN